MKKSTKDRVHSVFRAVGYPVHAKKIQTPTPAEALKVALETLGAPEPRTAEAAVAAMLYGVLRDSDEVKNAPQVVLRRAGYASERLLLEADLSPEHRARLESWTLKLKHLLPNAPNLTPMSWSANATPGRMARLFAERDAVNERWQVYGTARVREDVLAHVLKEAKNQNTNKNKNRRSASAV